MKQRLTMQELERLQAAGKIQSFSVEHKKPATPAEAERKPKYGNQKHEVDGRTFDSKKEAKRYGQLKMMLKAGLIGMLEMQVPFELQVNDKKVCKYIADFRYVIMATGETVVEDVKSEATRKLPVYRLKKKLMKNILGIEIKEV